MRSNGATTMKSLPSRWSSFKGFGKASRSCARSRPLPKQGLRPVSYTHLDVYKRQEQGGIPNIRELTKELGSLGVLGMHLEGYGCAGMTATEYGVACLEIEATDSGLRSLVSVQGSLAMFAIWRWGSEEMCIIDSPYSTRTPKLELIPR